MEGSESKNVDQTIKEDFEDQYFQFNRGNDNFSSDEQDEELKQSITAPQACQVPRSFSSWQTKRQSQQIEQKNVQEDLRMLTGDLNTGTRNSVLTEIRKSDVMKPQFASPGAKINNGSQSMVQYQKQLEGETPVKTQIVNKKKSISEANIGMRGKHPVATITSYGAVMSPSKSHKRSCKRKRPSDPSHQPQIQQMFSPQQKKLFKKSNLKNSSIRKPSDGLNTSSQINQSQIVCVHPKQPNEIAEPADEGENLLDDNIEFPFFESQNLGSEGPNKHIGESMSAHANKAIRLNKKRSKNIEEIAMEADAGFPREHAEEFLDQNAMSTREMLEKDNQSKTNLVKQLRMDKPLDDQMNRRNQVSSLKTRLNSEYFENAGSGMPYGELDEHGDSRQIDYDRITQIRRTIDPSSSNNSLSKSNQSYNKKMSLPAQSSKTPALGTYKKRSTPFIQESQRADLLGKIYSQNQQYLTMQKVEMESRSKSVLKQGAPCKNLSGELMKAAMESYEPKILSHPSANKDIDNKRGMGASSQLSMPIKSTFEKKSQSIGQINQKHLPVNLSAQLIPDENYGLSIMGAKQKSGDIFNYQSSRKVADRGANRSAMILGSTIQNNSSITKTTVQSTRKTDHKIQLWPNEEEKEQYQTAQFQSFSQIQLQENKEDEAYMIGPSQNKGRNHAMTNRAEQHQRTSSNLISGTFDHITSSWREAKQYWFGPDKGNGEKGTIPGASLTNGSSSNINMSNVSVGNAPIATGKKTTFNMATAQISQSAKYASNGADPSMSKERGESIYEETEYHPDWFDNKMHPTRIVERDWHNRYKLAQLIQKQERQIQQNSDSLCITIAQFGGITKDKLDEAFKVVKTRPLTTAAHRSPSRGRHLPPSNRSRQGGELTSVQRSKLYQSQKTIELSGRGSNFDTSDNNKKSNDGVLIIDNSIEPPGEQSGGSDDIGDLSSNSSEHWIQTCNQIKDRTFQTLDQPNMLLERLKEKKERTMSSMRETTSDVMTVKQTDNMSHMETQGPKAAYLQIPQSSYGELGQRVKLDSNTPHVRSGAMVTTGSETMHATQESINMQTLTKGLLNHTQAEEQSKDDREVNDSVQKPVMNSNAISLKQHKSRDLLLQDLQTTTMDAYLNNVPREVEKKLAPQRSQNELMSNSMANQSKFCDSDDFVMSNTSMSLVNQSNIVDNQNGVVNFDDIGNSLQGSQFSEFAASKVKQLPSHVESLDGAYGDPIVRNPSQYKANYSGSININLQGVGHDKSLIDVQKLNQRNDFEILNNFSITDDGEEVPSNASDDDFPKNGIHVHKEKISLLQDTKQSNSFKHQASNLQNKHSNLQVDKPSQLKKKTVFDRKSSQDNKIVAQYTGGEMLQYQVQQPQILGQPSSKMQSVSTANLKLTRQGKKQVNINIDSNKINSFKNGINQSFHASTTKHSGSISAKAQQVRRVSQDETASRLQTSNTNVLKVTQRKLNRNNIGGSGQASNPTHQHNFKSKLGTGYSFGGKSHSISTDLNRHKFSTNQAQTQSEDKVIYSAIVNQGSGRKIQIGNGIKTSAQVNSLKPKKVSSKVNKISIPGHSAAIALNTRGTISSTTVPNTTSHKVSVQQTALLGPKTPQVNQQYKLRQVGSGRKHLNNQSLDQSIQHSQTFTMLHQGTPIKQHNFNSRRGSKNPAIANSMMLQPTNNFFVKKKHSYASPEVANHTNNYLTSAMSSQFNAAVPQSMGTKSVSSKPHHRHQESETTLIDTHEPQQAQIEASQQLIRNQARYKNLKKSPNMQARMQQVNMSHQVSAVDFQKEMM